MELMEIETQNTCDEVLKTDLKTLHFMKITKS